MGVSILKIKWHLSAGIRKALYKLLYGSHCWFGSNVVILKGCTIGDNCVIGAGCVISQPIPDNSVVSMNRELSIVPIRK